MTVKLTKTMTVLIVILLSSCALSKAIYLGNGYPDRAAPQSADTPADAENINGVFPEAVYIKTRAQTFNTYHYYILNDGLIWYKSIDGKNEDKNDGKNGPADWTLFQKTGLPNNKWKAGFNKPARIVEISADADELVALSDEGGFYRYCFDKTIAHNSGVWLDRQGWPDGEQLFLDGRTAKNVSWALGKRNAQVLYYEDVFGNQHHNGTMEIATTYVLLDGGQEICYADTGLPADFSRNYSGPERGAFKAVALQASASTMFVINEAGEMYTRLADFDTAGCDPLWFKYTYTPYKSDLPGTDYFSNLNEWALPAEDWRAQPRIPLAGDAAITRHITILQNGQGNGARELRVAGLNEAGETGYWTKAVFDDAWGFKPVPLYFSGDAILKTANSAEINPQAARGPSPDKRYSGYFWNGGKKEPEWEYAIPNFNILEGDCDLQITWRGETCALKLYPVEMWTYLKRDYLPGRTGSPKMFLVTMEIPQNAFDGLSEHFTALLTQKYANNDKKLFQYTMSASDNYVLMRETGGTDAALFLTDGKISRRYPEFRQFRLVENFEEIRRYHSPELAISGETIPPREELIQKIEDNKTFRDKLKYQIRALNWSRLTAFKFNFGYLPVHYSAKFSPLRFVDMPKIRTVTAFGDRIILENSAYINTVSNTRIWLYEKIIELLEARLLYYRDIAAEYAKDTSNQYGMTEIPAAFRYSDNIADYWNIAGLPRIIQGTFFSPDIPPGRRTRPAVLSFLEGGADAELPGWRLSIGESPASASADERFAIFIDPLKSPHKIYSRHGKTPKEKQIRLDCILYLNAANNSAVGQDVAGMITPFIGKNSRGIKARIHFDGENFEIRQYPAEHGSSLIFQGKAAPPF